eukprot:PLAT6398.2.p1 GENE.PLAT6398.2~~PLAT6398.2.p1  ORF type:complete len:550 (+),score=270.64 PLAT6398.2:130-1779(+)
MADGDETRRLARPAMLAPVPTSPLLVGGLAGPAIGGLPGDMPPIPLLSSLLAAEGELGLPSAAIDGGGSGSGGSDEAGSMDGGDGRSLKLSASLMAGMDAAEAADVLPMTLPSSSGSVESSGPFEGPEKLLEVAFTPGLALDERGARAVTQAGWSAVLRHARCQILSRLSNRFFDAFLLSESSLFVYPWKLTLKTCGTTTLLHCLGPILGAALELGMQVEWVCYSRKRFMFPHRQQFPHTSFVQEVEFLARYFVGGAYVLGPITGDHWNVFVADYCERPIEDSTDRSLDIVMYDLPEDVAALFYKREQTADEVTQASGIADLLPGSALDSYLFEPCGYSMNGQLRSAYFTIHISPEPEISYASFETNAQLPSYSSLVRHVLAIFRPQRFAMTLFADAGAMPSLRSNPVEDELYSLPRHKLRYHRTCKSHAQIEGDTCCFMGAWSLPRALAEHVEPLAADLLPEPASVEAEEGVEAVADDASAAAAAAASATVAAAVGAAAAAATSAAAADAAAIAIKQPVLPLPGGVLPGTPRPRLTPREEKRQRSTSV